MAMIKCPECTREISDQASACPGCGHPIKGPAPAIVVSAPPAGPSPGVAAVLSLVIPGAGQMYAGSVGGGVLWLMFVVIGYLVFIVPGLVLHLLCILSAAQSARAAGTRAA